MCRVLRLTAIEYHLSVHLEEEIFTAYVGHDTQARYMSKAPLPDYFPIYGFMLRVFQEYRSGTDIFEPGTPLILQPLTPVGRACEAPSAAQLIALLRRCERRLAETHPHGLEVRWISS